MVVKSNSLDCKVVRVNFYNQTNVDNFWYQMSQVSKHARDARARPSPHWHGLRMTLEIVSLRGKFSEMRFEK